MKKMVRKILSPFILFLSLFCVFAIGYGSYVVAGYGMASTSGNVTVTASDVKDYRMTIGDPTVTGTIVYGPISGNNSGTIIDDGNGSSENLSVTITFSITTTTTFNGAITFSIAPDSSTDTSLSTNYSSAVTSGYITDPVAGEGNGEYEVGAAIGIAGVANGDVTAYTFNPITDNTTVGLSALVSNESTSGTTLTFDVSLTVTFGWGKYFTYTNPTLADELSSPNQTSAEMVTALQDFYTSLGASFNLAAVIGAEVDTTGSGSGGGATETLIASYDFSSWTSYRTNSSITLDEISATYAGGSSDSDPLTAVDKNSYVYQYESVSDTASYYVNKTSDAGYMKLGRDTTDGYGVLTLTFETGTNISKAVITAHSWAVNVSTGINRLGYLSVNDSDAQLASTSGTPEPLTFTFDAADTITIQTNNSGRRALIFSIEFY